MHDSKPPYSPFIQALLSGGAYPHPIDTILVNETHISWVLLTGYYAYKIKKPVKFAFLDFSTLERRRFFCEEELRLNRRLAADIYLDCVPITGTLENPKMDGQGEVIEYAIKMRQFPSGQLFSERAPCGLLTSEELEQLVQAIANFHLSIARADASSPYGDCRTVKHWFDENFNCIRPLLHDSALRQQLQEVQVWGESEWRRQSALMQERKLRWFVRECHGDLHLGNITVIDGKPVMFDCIEFNPELRWIDVISEMAFLVLDLLHFGNDRHAYGLLNRYLQLTGDYEGLVLLRYYLVYRALVRAKVALLTGTQPRADEDYRAYADLATRFIHPERPVLLITHGFSGSGKSFFARQLAARIGAIQIRSDIERKRLFGLREQDASGGGIYSFEANERTYRRLGELAKTILAAGYSVIIDAAFLKSAERDWVRDLAADCRVRFGVISVQAPEQALRARIESRKQDASEATVDVLTQQLRTAEPLTAAELDQALIISNDQQAVEASLAEIEAWLRDG